MPDKVEIKKKLVLINSASSLLTQFIQMTVMLWLHSFLVNRIDPSEYNIYVMVMTVMAFSPILTAILTSGQGRFIMEAYAEGDHEKITQIVSTLLPIFLVVGAILLLAGGIISWYIDYIFTIPADNLWQARIMMAMLFILFVLQITLVLFGNGFYVKQKFIAMNGIRLGFELLRIALLFIFLFGINTRVIWVTTAMFIANVASLLTIVFFSMRMLPSLRFKRSSIDWSIAGELTKFGSWMLLVNVSDKMLTSVGVIMLNMMGMVAESNYLFLAALPYRKLQSLEFIAMRPLGPALMSMHAQNQASRLGRVFIRGGRLGLWMIMLIVAPIIVFNDELILLWLKKEEMLVVAPVMAILLLCLPSQYGNLMLSKLAFAKNKVKSWALLGFGVQVVNLVVTYILIQLFQNGAMSAGLSLFLCVLLGEIIFLTPLGLRIAEVKFTDWVRETFVPGFMPTIGGILFLYCLKELFQPSSLAAVLGCITAGMVVYVMIMFAFCLQKPADDDLRKLMNRLLTSIPVLKQLAPK